MLHQLVSIYKHQMPLHDLSGMPLTIKFQYNKLRYCLFSNLCNEFYPKIYQEQNLHQPAIFK